MNPIKATVFCNPLRTDRVDNEIMNLAFLTKDFKVSRMGDEFMGYSYSIDVAEEVSIGFGCILGEGDPAGYGKWKKIYYPLLLQQAIDGVNKRYFEEGTGLIIEQTPTKFSVGTDNEVLKEFHFDYGTHLIDDARRQALDFVMDYLGAKK